MLRVPHAKNSGQLHNCSKAPNSRAFANSMVSEVRKSQNAPNSMPPLSNSDKTERIDADWRIRAVEMSLRNAVAYNNDLKVIAHFDKRQRPESRLIDLGKAVTAVYEFNPSNTLAIEICAPPTKTSSELGQKFISSFLQKRSTLDSTLYAIALGLAHEQRQPGRFDSTSLEHFIAIWELRTNLPPEG